MDNAPSDYKQDYETFWKNLVEKDGVLDLDSVQRELFDYLNLMKRASHVYCHVTGNRISKTNTLAKCVINEADERCREWTEEVVKEELEIARQEWLAESKTKETIYFWGFITFLILFFVLTVFQ